MDYIIEILEESVKKHGEKPLTNKWLLNILKLAEKNQTRDEEEFDPYGAIPCHDWGEI